MTPKQALQKLYKRHKTLLAVKELLGKNRVKTSVPTLSRILTKEGYQPGYKLSLAILSAANGGKA